MVTLKVTVEDKQADALAKLLREVSFVKAVEEEHPFVHLNEPEMPYERIKKLLDAAEGKKLFEDIKDPSAWQREIRKEWERDS